MLRLNPPIPLSIRLVDGKWHKAMGHVLIDYGYEHDIMFVCFVDETRECWTVTPKDARSQDNITAGRLPRAAPDDARSRQQEFIDGR
jgi:hypothetical protein